ncbi:MAG TPA: ABC transporter permease [Vicinamibacterales bacterium]
MRDAGVLIVVAALLIGYFAVAADQFFSLATLQVIAAQVPAALLLATAVTIVMLAGGIDLSVGSVLGLSGAVLGYTLIVLQWPLPLATLACLAAGLACGAFNGAATVIFRVPSFIVTLAMLEIARALTFLLTSSRTLYIGSAVEGLSAAAVAGVSVAFIVAIAIVILVELVIRRSVFGRRIVAVGDNPRAAWAAGVDPRPVQAATFALSGLLAAIAAVVHTSRLASADPNAGTGFELQAIAAAVIGGTSLLGGRGSAVQSALGALLIAILATGLAQIGASDATKRLVTGIVILCAVVIDASRHRDR